MNVRIYKSREDELIRIILAFCYGSNDTTDDRNTTLENPAIVDVDNIAAYFFFHVMS